MNKYMLTLLFLGLIGNVSAKLEFDSNTGRYYSTPVTKEINQNEYHKLVWACKDIQKNCYNQQAALNAKYAGCGNGSHNNAYGPEYVKNMIIDYLNRIATPTSMRLLKDLHEINFVFKL